MNNLFLKADNVAGESQDAAHKGSIDINSYNWGAQRAAAGNGAVSYNNLSVHTIIDKATPAMLLFASNGTKIRKVELSGCKAGGTAIEYYRITLEDVIVAQILLSDSGDANVEYEFQADSVKMQYWEQSPTGGKGAETRSGWNIKNNVSQY